MMASSEKQAIPLDDILQKHESFAEQPSTTSTDNLVPAKFPSRPRRKVAVILIVNAVAIVVIIAAALIGKYVPEYLSDRPKLKNMRKTIGVEEENHTWRLK